MFFLDMGSAEDELIDSTGEPDTFAYPATQADSAGVSRATSVIGRASFYLPDAAIGSRPGAGNINGANIGTPSWPQSHVAPNGMIGWFPQIQTNAGQGNVGETSRATRQYLGVLDQLSNYGATPSYIAGANWVGIPVTAVPTNG